MSLREYNKKRDFKKTREPIGETVEPKERLSFVIQKHDASHLHYDFRLEINGVLKSWAVPKGPSLDPAQKRLAMQVEDHPYSYGSFEGTIPKGEYGGGTVMLWDFGEWIPQDSKPLQAWKKGSLKFELKGKKLSGLWKLFRMSGGKAWLLMKAKDAHSKSLRDGDILAADLSAKTGRDLIEIGEGKKVSKTLSKLKRKIKVATQKAAPTKIITPGAAKELNKILTKYKITHPERIYYPQSGIRKIDLIEYYLSVADRILEHISDRPLMIVRCPAGAEEQCFYQKHWTKTFPSSIKKIKVKGEKEPFFGVDSKEGLIGLAQVGALEVHIWNTHFEHIENPDQWVFDIDPDPTVSWEKVTSTALLVRDRLNKLGLKSFLKTTGGKGLHVVVPIKPKLDWELSRNFTKAICEDIANENPALYLVNMSKAKRKNRIFLDYLRNGRGATAVAPYSPRKRSEATVSLPISWEKIHSDMKSDTVQIQDIVQYLKTDPWKNFYQTKQIPRIK